MRQSSKKLKAYLDYFRNDQSFRQVFSIVAVLLLKERLYFQQNKLFDIGLSA